MEIYMENIRNNPKFNAIKVTSQATKRR